MNTKCSNCGLINWQDAGVCKRCQTPLGASATAEYTQRQAADYTPHQWASPYATHHGSGYEQAAVYTGDAGRWSDGVWREKEMLVAMLAPTREATLPNACVRCGNRVEVSDFKKKFSWHPPAYYLLILISWLVYLVVALCIRKQATLYMGVCDEHRAKRRTAIMLSWLLAGIGAVMVFAGISGDAETLVGLGGLNVLGAITYGLLSTRLVRVKKISDRFIWLKGVSPDYLAQLPDWPGDAQR